ncbi:hypothetical protein [Halegenticoccus tardaugens]|uniref:hypothetical protein n=1 Tax=Halegenticoccus tardaugens TaxID=2071624 RepID=UPI00100A57F4|nr:hypothetical protein [Halegenticoccus tardaugens]
MREPPHAPNPVYSPRTTVAGTLVFLALNVALVIVVSEPRAAAVAFVAAAAAYGVATRALSARRRAGGQRTVCVPRTDICITA